MTNEELVTRIKAGIDTADNMLQIWQQCRKFIHSIARHYQGNAEIEDLEQEGYLALYDAVDGFNADKGYKFLTYAEHWIRQRMLRYIQNNGTVRIPVHEQAKLREYKQLLNAYRIHLGRKPTRHEIAYGMGISDKEVVSLEKTAKISQIGSIDSYVTDEDSSTIGDMVPGNVDIEGDVLEDMQQEQLAAILWTLVDALPEQQGYVIRQRFQEGKTLKATGDGIGETISRVRTIESNALCNLERSKLLRMFAVDEDIYSMGLVGNGAARFNTTWTSSTERAVMRLYE